MSMTRRGLRGQVHSVSDQVAVPEAGASDFLGDIEQSITAQESPGRFHEGRLVRRPCSKSREHVIVSIGP